MELKVQEFKTPEAILFNYEELKQAVIETTKPYEALVYTADQMTAAKADRAKLNKLKKALNDDRIKREREYLEPFNEYKGKINEIIAILDKGVKNIDGQIKTAEENRKEEKMQEILQLLESIENVPEWLHIGQIFNEKWLNSSVKISAIEKEITEKLEIIEKDLTVLRELPEFSFEAIEEYKQSLDVIKAINAAKRAEDIAKKKADAELLERKKAEFAKIAQAQETNNTSEAIIPQNVQVETEKSWVSFRALLSTEDASELKKFFNNRNIDFRKI